MGLPAWNLRTWVYFLGVVTLGGIAVVTSTLSLIAQAGGERWWLLMLGLMPVLGRTFIQLPNMNGRICPTGILTQFGALRFGMAEGVIVALVEAVVVSRQQTADRLTRTLFNVGAMCLAISMAGLVGEQVGAVQTGWLWTMVTAMSVALVYFVLNVGLVMIMVWLTAGFEAVAQARTALLWSWAPYVVGGVVAGLLTAVGGTGLSSIVALLVGLVSLGVTALALKQYFEALNERDNALGEVSTLLDQKDGLLSELRQTHMASLKTLATAIEAKDPMTHGHVVRVEILATILARKAGLDETQVEAVKVGAMLHDIGKLAVPEYLLHPNRKLTEEDRIRLRSHAHLGAAILSNSRLHPDVVTMIRHHHERYDGTGYPAGMEGQQIPIGARILSVADTYDKLRHPAGGRGLSSVEAGEHLRRQMGMALDPWLVELVVEKEGALLEEAEGLALGDGFASRTADSESASGALEAFEWQHRESSVVFGLGECLRATMDPREMMKAMADAICHLVPCETAVVFVPAQGDSEGLVLGTVHGKLPADLDLLVESGWPRKLSELVAQQPFHLLKAEAAEIGASCALFAMPLTGLERGLVVLLHKEPFDYDENRRRAVAIVVEQSGTAIGNARAFHRFQELSVTDALTGLHNGRQLRDRAPEIIQRGLDSEEGGCVVMMDLNGFKGINDTLGHDHGDALLVGIARVLVRHVRKGDLVVRRGGDEFVVMFPGITPEALHERLERIDHDACQLWPDDWAFARGTSVGVAWFPEDGRTLDALLPIADERMYEDKVKRKADRAAVMAALASRSA